MEKANVIHKLHIMPHQACTAPVPGSFSRCQKMPFQTHENDGGSPDIKPTKKIKKKKTQL